MRGMRWTLLLALCALLAAMYVPGGAWPRSTTPPAGYVSPASRAPQVTGTSTGALLAGWHPLYEQGGQARDLALDPARGRILLTASFFTVVNYTNTTPNYGWVYNLLVLNLSGGLLHNLSLPSGPLYGGSKTIAIDPATGDAFVPGYNSTTGENTLMVVDPGTGTILHVWSYAQPLNMVVYGGGFVVSDSCCHSPIQVINATTGVVVGTLSAYINAWQDLVVDPSGTRLYAFSQGLVGGPGYGDVFRFDLPNGAPTDLSLSAGTGTLSADGTRLYLCGSPSYLTGFFEFITFWFSNGTIVYGPPCSGLGMRTNPVTDVVAFASSGLLMDANGTDGSFHIWDPSPYGGYSWQAVDVAWTADGRKLVALNGSVTPIQVGTWDGATWLGGAQGRLVNPHTDPICFPFVTSEGVQGSTVTLYRDGYVLGLGTTDMTSACFGNMTNTALPLPDGPHVGRIRGQDKAGLPFDRNVTFQTDGSPPGIVIRSPLTTGISPYDLLGTLDESHPGAIAVNGRPVPLTGDNWSVALDLIIGNNSVYVWANDTLGNWNARDLVIRYWPSLLNNLTDAAEHFQVSVPPGWNGSLSAPSASGAVTADLTAPGAGSVAKVSVSAIRATLTEDQATAYAYALQAWNASPLPAIEPLPVITNLTVDGHPAAQFDYSIRLNGTVTYRLETYVVSGPWQRVYVIRYDAPYPGSNYGQTSDWVLQSFAVAPSGSSPPGGPGSGPASGPPLLLWLVAGAAAGAIAAIAVALIVLRRRGRDPHP